jgi:SAM-dependent methyltransferase
MKRWVPWYGKIIAKLVLSRLPLQYQLWRKINLFSHGAMHRPEYAHRVFTEHFQRFRDEPGKSGFVALEVGPGDSLSSAVIAKAYGASTCHLIDSAPFASKDLALYRAMEEFLRELNLSPPELTFASDLEGVLKACSASYATSGLNSMRKLSESSVDFIWSHAVLEHIRRDEFVDFVAQMRRIIRPTGICSHRVDLRDHLGGDLNNLRLSSHLWEAEWFAKSGFYTNRIRYEEMLEIFRNAGFSVEVTAIDRWATIPTPQQAMAVEFRSLSKTDLLVSGFSVTLRPQ